MESRCHGHIGAEPAESEVQGCPHLIRLAKFDTGRSSLRWLLIVLIKPATVTRSSRLQANWRKADP
jgi:hypothetical protein